MPFSELPYLVCSSCVKCHLVSCIILFVLVSSRYSSLKMLLGIYIPFLLFFLRPYLVFPVARHSESCSVVFESHDGKLGCDENFNEDDFS